MWSSVNFEKLSSLFSSLYPREAHLTTSLIISIYLRGLKLGDSLFEQFVLIASFTFHSL